MVETVETVTLNKSPIIKPGAQSNARNVLRAQEASKKLQATEELRVQDRVEIPYISPFVHVDVTYDKAVLQLRDSSSGEVLEQFPSTKVLEERRVERARVDAELSAPVREVSTEKTTVSESQAQLIKAQSETVQVQTAPSVATGQSLSYQSTDANPVKVDVKAPEAPVATNTDV